jgi:hypothetical protein
MNYEIKINQIFTSNSNIEGEISVVAFIIEGTEDQFTASCYGEIKLNPADPNSFINLNNTTEDNVVKWVKDALGDKLADYERIVQERINAQNNPLVATPLPWVKEEVIEPIIPPIILPTRTGNAYPKEKYEP